MHLRTTTQVKISANNNAILQNHKEANKVMKEDAQNELTLPQDEKNRYDCK